MNTKLNNWFILPDKNIWIKYGINSEIVNFGKYIELSFDDDYGTNVLGYFNDDSYDCIQVVGMPSGNSDGKYSESLYNCSPFIDYPTGQYIDHSLNYDNRHHDDYLWRH